MLGISLYSYLYLKLAKMLALLSLIFSLQQNWRRGQNRFCLKVRGVAGERESRERDGPKNVCT
jgi:hypothetical protein